MSGYYYRPPILDIFKPDSFKSTESREYFENQRLKNLYEKEKHAELDNIRDERKMKTDLLHARIARNKHELNIKKNKLKLEIAQIKYGELNGYDNTNVMSKNEVEKWQTKVDKNTELINNQSVKINEMCTVFGEFLNYHNNSNKNSNKKIKNSNKKIKKCRYGDNCKFNHTGNCNFSHD